MWLENNHPLLMVVFFFFKKGKVRLKAECVGATTEAAVKGWDSAEYLWRGAGLCCTTNTRLNNLWCCYALWEKEVIANRMGSWSQLCFHPFSKPPLHPTVQPTDDSYTCAATQPALPIVSTESKTADLSVSHPRPTCLTHVRSIVDENKNKKGIDINDAIHTCCFYFERMSSTFKFFQTLFIGCFDDLNEDFDISIMSNPHFLLWTWCSADELNLKN